MDNISGSVAKFIWRFMRQQPSGFALLFITSLATAFSASIWPEITSRIIDSLSTYTGDKADIFKTFTYPLLMALGFWVFIEILSRGQGITWAVINPKLEAQIRMNTFERMHSHSYSYYTNNRIGGLANRISDLPRSVSVILDALFVDVLPVVVAVLISSSLFFQMDPILALILFGWLGSHFLICTYACNVAAEYSRTHSESLTQLQGNLVDSITNHKNVKLFANQAYEYDHLIPRQELERKQNFRAKWYMQKVRILLAVIAFFGLSSLFYLTLSFWQQDIVSIGSVIFVLNSALNLLTMAWAATEELTYLFREIGVCRQGLKLMQAPRELSESESSKALKIKTGQIKFEKVNFNYRFNDNVFKDKSLTIEGGQKIGLVGFSGSGKTTFAHLILKLFDVASGKIKIDGQDISKISLKSLRKEICLIPQEPMLFHRSILENIRYGKLDATMDEVKEAAIKANCHEFISNLEDGYHTIVGDLGSKISGGQKQRIAIARAILRDSTILIMDEATSALDSFTEKLIQKSLNYLTKDRTTIIIAHRLSTLLEVDRILVFDKGTIIEDGTHEELLKAQGHYATMWKMQSAGFLPQTQDQ